MVQNREVTDIVLPKVIEAIEKRKERQAAVEDILNTDILMETVADLYSDQEIYETDKTAAVEIAIKEMLAFPKELGLGYQLAKSWVYRKEITKGVGIPVLAGGIALGVGYGVFQLIEAANEKGVEAEIEDIYSSQESLRNQSEALSSSPVLARLPAQEREHIGLITASVSQQLNQLEVFLSEYCPNGQADEAVTSENYENLDSRITEAQTLLSEARTSLDSALSPIRRQEDLELITETLNDAHGGIMGVAQEQAARDRAETIYNQAQENIGRRNLEGLRQLSSHLTDLNTILNEEYQIIITGGNRRIFNNDPNRRSHYLIVQAQTRNGRVLTRNIPNEEENGRIYAVSEWAERVPESVYNRVGNDKRDDGIIQDNIFGTKRRGYQNVDYNLSFGRLGGQITRWEDRSN